MLEITTAERIIDTELERQISRRVVRETPLVQAIYRAFVARGGPVALEDLTAELPGMSPDIVESRLAGLDADDLIQLTHRTVEIAYPFAARPTPFVVRLAEGRERYACCAIDALGMAPMLRQRVEVTARCHHCGTLLSFAVSPEGPDSWDNEVMVWVGRRCGEERRALTGH